MPVRGGSMIHYTTALSLFPGNSLADCGRKQMSGGKGKAYCYANALRNVACKKATHATMAVDGWPERGIGGSGLKIRKFRYDIETRTGLAGVQIPVSDNQSRRICLVQTFKQKPQGCMLFRRTGIERALSVGCQTAHITHPDAVPVVVPTMGAGSFHGAGGFDSSIGGNHIMISASVPAAGTMQAVEILTPQPAVRLVGRTMHHDKRYLSHGSQRLPAILPPAAPVTSSSRIRTT